MPDKSIFNIMSLIKNLFFLKINFLFLDNIYNYNYLPISNKMLFEKNAQPYKIVKYFNIKVFFFLGL